MTPFAVQAPYRLNAYTLFPYQTVLAGDIDAKLVKSLRSRERQQQRKIVIGRWDALNLRTFAPDSVDKIVTDPPWGFFQKQSADPEQFQRKMLHEFHRVLRRNGLLVLLAGRPQLFEDSMHDFKGSLTVVKRYDVLVSGKKAMCV